MKREGIEQRIGYTFARPELLAREGVADALLDAFALHSFRL